MPRPMEDRSFVTTDADGRRWAFTGRFLDSCAISVDGAKVYVGSPGWGGEFDRGTELAARQFAAELLRFRGDDKGALEMLGDEAVDKANLEASPWHTDKHGRRYRFDAEGGVWVDEVGNGWSEPDPPGGLVKP